METPLIAAIVAAVASSIAAVLAHLSSVRANAGATAINSANQRVARLDREATQLREDFVAYMLAVGRVQAKEDIGPLLGAGEVLCANPRATAGMVVAVDKLRRVLQGAILKGPRQTAMPEEPFLELRQGLAQALASIASDREHALEGATAL